MPAGLVCWKCGASLADVGRINRLTLCPTCRADLHVCRLCRHYDRQALGECRHERAERILDKDLANFCTYFRPRPGAHEVQSNSAADEAKARLDALFAASFGVAPDDAALPDASSDPSRSAAEKAREELDALFRKKPPET